MSALGLYRSLIVNREKPPFDNSDLRRAMALSIDRKAFVDILSQGQGEIGGILQPPPGGLWGMPADQIETISMERIADELRKLLICPGRAQGINLLYETGLVSPILRELVPMKGLPQGLPERWQRSRSRSVSRAVRTRHQSWRI